MHPACSPPPGGGCCSTPTAEPVRSGEVEQAEQFVPTQASGKVKRHVVHQPIEERLLALEDALLDGVFAGVFDDVPLKASGATVWPDFASTASSRTPLPITKTTS